MAEIAHTSDITIRVGLSANRSPVHIEWTADDLQNGGQMEACKAMFLSLFNREQRDTLRIDLWTEDMQVQEMDRFVYQTLRAMSETYLRATQNKQMAEQMARFAQFFGEETEILPRSG